MGSHLRCTAFIFAALVLLPSVAEAAPPEKALAKTRQAVASAVEALEAAPVCCRSWQDLTGAIGVPRGGKLKKLAVSKEAGEFPVGRSRYLLLAVDQPGTPFVLELMLERRAHSAWQHVMSAFLPVAQLLDSERSPVGEPIRPRFVWDPSRGMRSGFFAELAVDAPEAAFVVLYSDPALYGQVMEEGKVDYFTVSPVATVVDFEVNVVASPEGAVRARIR